MVCLWLLCHFRFDICTIFFISTPVHFFNYIGKISDPSFDEIRLAFSKTGINLASLNNRGGPDIFIVDDLSYPDIFFSYIPYQHVPGECEPAMLSESKNWYLFHLRHSLMVSEGQAAVKELNLYIGLTIFSHRRKFYFVKRG